MTRTALDLAARRDLEIPIREMVDKAFFALVFWKCMLEDLNVREGDSVTIEAPDIENLTYYIGLVHQHAEQMQAIMRAAELKEGTRG